MPPCQLDELLPFSPDGSSYLPPLDLNKCDIESSLAFTSQSDAEATHKRNEFNDRVAELRVDNDLAFRIVNRIVPAGNKAPRLAFMRKFWEGLETMAAYWDCSLDHEFTEDDSSEQSVKRQKLEVGPSAIDSGDCLTQTEQNPPNISDSTTTTPEDIGESAQQNATPSVTTVARSRMRYKGRRTGTGREMPDNFRADTVRAFVDGTIWPFRTSVSPPRMVPLIQFNKINLPVRQTAAVYRVPKDRSKSRSGWLEGPLVSIQVRPETDFVDDSSQQLPDKARLDLLREIAALLQLAQERRRMGLTEVKPGEGKWWTTKPRWGGGARGDVQNQHENSDILQAVEELLGAPREKIGRKERGKSRNKITPAILWKEVKCGQGLWDPKTDYTAIGKHPDSQYDEVGYLSNLVKGFYKLTTLQVFLVSSLNHHLSLLKLTVHEAYMDYLTFGNMPQTPPEDTDWSRPKLQRSKWYDLFQEEQRVEAFRGLWGVMAFLCRSVDPAARTESQPACHSTAG